MSPVKDGKACRRPTYILHLYLPNTQIIKIEYDAAYVFFQTPEVVTLLLCPACSFSLNVFENRSLLIMTATVSQTWRVKC